MTEPSYGLEPARDDHSQSLPSIGSALLRWRRFVVGLAAMGAIIGLASALLTPRVYVSRATFLTQGQDPNASGIALAASQFGIRVPTTANSWGPPVYVKLLHSPALLESIAVDTVSILEERGRRAAIMDLLAIEGTTRELRLERAVRALEKIIRSQEIKAVGAVEVAVKTKWPSMSFAVAERLVYGLSRFNLETRKSQAGAERQFVATLAVEAERGLRDAEDDLQFFLQRNRITGTSPELLFQRDRLQRQVALRQQVYTSLIQSREEARIREVRETPVITVLEQPRLPTIPESRRAVLKAIVGLFLGALFGALLAFIAEGVGGPRGAGNTSARRFLELVEGATPRFLRRARR